MRIRVSAPGKLMLMGEHAVVYDHPCLVTAVDKRLYVEAEIIDTNEDEIIAPQVKESRFVLETIAYFKKQFKINQFVKISTNGDFSHRVGLGSSSAVTVATFKALSLVFNINLSDRQIFDLSYYVNLAIQGVGSGFDIAIATFGKTIYFVTGGKTIEPLNLKPLPLVVGYSGIKADTPFYIRKVREAFRSRQTQMDKMFEEIESLVMEGKLFLQNNDHEKMGKLMVKNHQLLQQLGVSIPKLDLMVEKSVEAGAWGAKLSGAGGGDCMIALVEDDKRRAVENAIKSVGGEIITVDNNADGVRVEK